MFRLRFNNVYKQKCALTIGEQYELKLFAILHNDPYSSKVSKTWVYSLHHVNNGKTEANQIMHFSFGKAIDNTEGIPSLYFGSLALFKPSDASVYNSIKLDSFKVYFVDHHEKIELFRESDGVNVSRVNIDNSFYKEMPVNTKPDDSLICKISWLNATNDDIKYRIAYLEDDLPINMFYKRQNTNIVFPTDGSVVDMSSFQHDGRFTVAANSEGYILVDLPKHAKNVERVKVQLSYEGIGETGQLMHPLPQFRRASADDLLVTKYRDDSFDTHTAEAIFDAEFIPIPR